VDRGIGVRWVVDYKKMKEILKENEEMEKEDEEEEEEEEEVKTEGEAEDKREEKIKEGSEVEAEDDDKDLVRNGEIMISILPPRRPVLNVNACSAFYEKKKKSKGKKKPFCLRVTLCLPRFHTHETYYFLIFYFVH
jgi:hypothetical protein